MAEFAAELQSFSSRPPPLFPMMENIIDHHHHHSTMDQQHIPPPHPFTELNHFSILQTQTHNEHSSNLIQTFHSFTNNDDDDPIPTTTHQTFFTTPPHQILPPDDVVFNHHHHQNYMNIVDHGNHQAPESSSMDVVTIVSPDQASESGNKRKQHGSRKGGGGGKRVMRRKEEAGEGCGNDEKLKEVVHVRARRGQATDSHSLAERVRRGKINERLRCLQNIVPGCYKTMGMAVMLDEIINYVQSLQNQVEFLSMKLTAASTFYDFNAETEAVETLQRAKLREAKEEGRGGGGYGEEDDNGGFSSCFHSTWSL